MHTVGFCYLHRACNRGKTTTTKNMFQVQYLAERAGTVTPGLFHLKACALNHSAMVSNFIACCCSSHLGRPLLPLPPSEI